MNHLPELKSFLKSGEAESYRGVEVTYVPGRSATMTIFKDGVQQEEINLRLLKTKADMHAMMIEKGFVKKSLEELGEVKKEKKKEVLSSRQARRKEKEAERQVLRQESELLGKSSPSYGNIMGLYIAAGIAGLALVISRRKRRRSSN